MKKILSKILLCILMLNTIFSTGLATAFAHNNSLAKASGGLYLKWNSTLTLTENFEQISRGDDSDTVFLSWDISKLNGVSVDSGTYTLTYPIADGKVIEFKIVKNGDNATITYKVNGDNTVDFSTGSNKQLEIYKSEEKIYKLANTTNFPVTDQNFTFKANSSTGNAESVEFSISKGKGFSFKYFGNTINFIWKDNLFYFATNGISQGNIYGFNLSLDKDNDGNINETDYINVFTGINKSTFTSTPIANGGKGTSISNSIDQASSRPLTETVGEEAQIKLSFEMIKEYNQATNKFEYIQQNDANIDKKATQVIIDLGNLDTSKAFQVTIKNIYADDLSGEIAGLPANVEAEIERSSDNSKLTITLKNSAGVDENDAKISAGIIYNPVKITATRDETASADYNFYQLATTIPIGTVYTYPKYSIVSLGTNEFYIKFTPFKDYNGYYTIKQGSGSLEKWAEYEETNKGAEDFMIAVPISIENGYSPERYFQVDFRFAPTEDSPTEENVLSSQIVKYKAYESDIMLATPENLQINDANIIKNLDLQTGEESENLYVNFNWDLGYEEILKGIVANNGGNPIEIKYTFYSSLTPNDEKGEELISVTITVDANGEYTISSATKADGTEYNGTFISGEITEKTETINGKQRKIIGASVNLKIPVSAVTDTNNKLQLQYPNIYFISTKATYKINTGTITETYETGKSLTATLTLNGILNIELLPTQNLEVMSGSVGNNEFQLKFDTLSYENVDDLLNSYYETMVKPNELDFDENSIRYNVYISQDKTIFDEMIKLDSSGQDKYENLTNNIKDKIKIYDYESQVIGSDINAKDLKIDNTSLIDYLRQNNVVKIENMVQNKELSNQIITLTGLDENQIYYVMIETVVYPVDSNGDIYEKKIDISKYSTIVTATTKKDTQEPDNSEKVPSVPTNFTYEDVTLNSVNLLWEKVKEISAEGKDSTLEYEFIKIGGEQLSEEILKSRNSYSKVWNQISNIANKEGFRTSGENILEYVNNAFSLASTDDYEYINYTGEQGNILDKTLSPNQIYFYYIRTVRIIDGEDVAYSTWVPLSITTKNVNAPTNLAVDRAASYDPKSEVVINFDIPKMNLDLIGTEYQLQYSIKKDSEDWQVDKTMNVNNLTITENKDGKTLNVSYKITGLEFGALYTIRVRLYNTIMESPSMYSNEVDHRTDSNNQANDYDSSINSWYDYFKELVKELEKEPYWFIADNSNTTSVIYRPEYFDNILSKNTTSVISLAEGQGGVKKEYYIPASVILTAFEQNKGFKISYNGMDVIFSAKSIDPIQNEVIKNLVARMSTDGLKDYFVKLTADFSNATYLIERINNTSPVVTIYMEVIGATQEIDLWDSYRVGYIEELLKKTKYSTSIQENIKKLVEKNTDRLTINAQTNSYVAQFKTEFGNYLEKELKNISKRTFSTASLNGNIIIAYGFEADATAKGYQLALGNWVAKTISDYSGKKAITTTEFGTFTFTSTKLVINGLESLSNGGTITQIIAKYGLDDYLGKNGSIDLKASLTNNMAIGCLARIAGNSTTKEPAEFLKEKGITVSTRNGTSPISSQEVVYLTMKIYEIRANANLETIKISNYNLTSGISGINSKYKKAIQVAFNLGIYTNENMQPSGAMTVQEFLEMLGNLSVKIGI